MNLRSLVAVKSGLSVLSCSPTPWGGGMNPCGGSLTSTCERRGEKGHLKRWNKVLSGSEFRRPLKLSSTHEWAVSRNAWWSSGPFIG